LTDIHKLVNDTLEASGYPVAQQGSYGEKETLPDTHITYMMMPDRPAYYVNNVPKDHMDWVQAAIYSTDPAITQAGRATLDGLMLPAGFTRKGGRDLPLDKSTGQYGYTCDYGYFSES
jgi:hypothetical protein